MLRVLALLFSISLFATPALASSEPTKLAVMYFESSGGNPQLDMLRLGLAQMLITDLSGSGRYDVLERTRLNELLAELELQKTDAVDADTAVQAGKLVGAHYMVLGSYFELMGTLRVDARVVEVATGRVVSVGASGSTADFMTVEKSVAEALEGAIAQAEQRRIEAGGAARPAKKAPGKQPSATPRETREPGTKEPATEPTRGDPKSGTATEPAEGSTPEPATTEPAPASSDPLGAALAFSEGLDLLDRKDLKRARAQFERALQLDPALADARAELAALPI